MTGEGAGNYINVRIPSICVLILSKADRDTTINARDVKDGTYRFWGVENYMDRQPSSKQACHTPTPT